MVQGAAFPHLSNLVYWASGKKKNHARMPMCSMAYWTNRGKIMNRIKFLLSLEISFA